MDSFAALLEELGPLGPTAAALGVGIQAVSNMKARNSVSPIHWPKLLQLATERGLEGVTFEAMSGWYSRRAVAA